MLSDRYGFQTCLFNFTYWVTDLFSIYSLFDELTLDSFLEMN